MTIVFPARAGMSPVLVDAGYADEGVPRASGDEPGSMYGLTTFLSCSPRERG